MKRFIYLFVIIALTSVLAVSLCSCGNNNASTTASPAPVSSSPVPTAPTATLVPTATPGIIIGTPTQSPNPIPGNSATPIPTVAPTAVPTSVPTQTPDISSGSVTIYVAIEANFRKTASLTGELITVLPVDTAVELIEFVKGSDDMFWAKVTKGSDTGYISFNLLDGPSEPASLYVKLTDKNSSVRIRSSNSTSSAIVAEIKHGTKVEFLDTASKGWIRVKSDTFTGYVRSDYLSVTQPD